MEILTQSEEVSFLMIGQITKAIHALKEEDLNAFRKLIGAQIVHDQSEGNVTADHINNVGKYNLTVLRSYEAVRNALRELNARRNNDTLKYVQSCL